MKNKYFLPVISIVALMIVNFSVSQADCQSPQGKPVHKQTIQYTCPMHPLVIQKLPGECPNCGMKLIEKKDKPQPNDSATIKNDNMKINPDTTILDKKQILPDSAMMKKDPIMPDTIMIKQDHLNR